MEQYQKLMNIQKESTILRNISGVLNWDMEVKMPKKGVNQRSEQLAMMSGFIHEKTTNPEIGNYLKEIQANQDFERFGRNEKRNVELIQRNYDKATKIPKEFAQELTKHGAIATQSWKNAKERADYSIFKKDLAKMIDLMKKQANYFDPDKDPYDVLLDFFEHGFSKKIYDKIFEEAKEGLIPIIKSCVESPNQPDSSLILREVPIEIQRKIAFDIAKLVHYDLEGGRIDEAVHPFTGGYFDDVRITVKYYLNDFTSAFYAALHEAGHGIYEQNYPQEFKYQPIGTSSSSAMHEGQARFIENIIGRSDEFWEFYLPRFKELTGKIFEDVQLQPFVHAINQVIPSKIRIHADPVTYSMHIILRYEIEKDIFSDKITVDEIPAVWNQKMKDYLGMDIENDTEGCLQDTHWAWQYFGYFPTYALGSYYNAQFLSQMKNDIPNWRDEIRSGKIETIHNWLNVNIRNKGCLLDPLDMIKDVTGKDFSAKYFIDNTQEKYSKLYGF
ncbi:MAG: carboxypeptidase M32 [Candidatus Heimdallarchaeota archaeon]|nr:carboxypeptidase M32 [Candidatus Heimdallarchaeota archaeon]